MPQPTQKRGAKKVSSPEQRLEKIRSDREKNRADQESYQQKLTALKKAETALEQEESMCVMEIIRRNAAAVYGKKFTTVQLLEYLNKADHSRMEPCIGSIQSEEESTETPGESAETEPCIGLIQSEEESAEPPGESDAAQPCIGAIQSEEETKA